MRGGARILWLVRAAIALDSMLYSGLIPLLPQLGRQGGLSDAILGLLLGVYPLAGVVACIPFGLLSDRWRPQQLLAGGMIGTALSALAIALWPAPLVIGLGRFVQGIAGSAVWTAGFTLMNQMALPDRRAREIGMSYSAASVGEMAGPLLSGFLAERASSGLFFWISGLISALISASLFIVRPGRAEPAAPASSGPRSRQAHIAALAVGAVLAVVYYTIYGGLMLIVPLVLSRDYGLTAFQIGQVFVGLHLVLIASQIAGGHWGDHAPRLVPIVAGTLAMAAGLLVMGTWPSLGGALGGIGLAGVGVGVAATVASPLFSEAWSEVQPAGAGMGVAFGAMNAIWALGFSLGNTGGGLLLGAVPAQAVLVGAAGLALATGLGALWMGKVLLIRPSTAPMD